MMVRLVPRIALPVAIVQRKTCLIAEETSNDLDGEVEG